MYTCKVCITTAEHQEYTVSEMMYGSGDRFRYFQCSACGCLQIAEFPDNIGKYYPQNYYSFTSNSGKRRGRSLRSAWRRIKDRYSVFDRGILGTLISRVAPNRNLTALAGIDMTIRSRILDMGCGDGSRVYALKEAGFETVMGADPYIPEDIIYENGVRVLKKNIHEIGGRWDVIMYHHSFEHIPDPSEELKAAAQLLAPGGCCLIRIPTVSSYAWDHYRGNWYQLDAPRHYFLHSIESMQLLAERAGLLVRDVVYDSSSEQFRESEKYLRKIPHVSAEDPFTRKQVRAWKRLSLKLNREKRGDQAAFYLMKK